MNYTEQDVRNLYVSVWRNRPAVMLELLDKGVPINHAYFNGRRLLHVAAWFNHCELLQTLITKGALLEVVDDLGTTPLLLAIRNDSFSCFKALSQQRSKSNNRFLINVPQGSPLVHPLHELAKSGRLDWLTWAKHHNLIDDLNVQNDKGETLAHIAHQKGQWKMLHFLISAGLDQQLSNNDGVYVKDLLSPRNQKKVRSFSGKLVEPTPDIV